MRALIYKRKILSFAVVVMAGVMLVVAASASRQTPPYQSPSYWPELRNVAGKVDSLILANLQQNSLNPESKAEELTIARRLSLALHGTIPSLQEIRELESLPASTRWEQWIDKLLADKRFSDYFAERFARTFVPAGPVEPFFTFRRRRFVAWLRDQLDQNRPYDEIVRELVASEGVWTDKPATNFITGHERDPKKLAVRTTRAFLGLRIDCAECHNHPFKDWKQEDFRGLAAFYGQAKLGFTGIRDDHDEFILDDERTKEKIQVDPKVPFAGELLPTQGRRREQLALWITNPQNPYFAKATVNRLWALLFGRGMTDPIDDLEQEEKIPKVLDVVAADFQSHGFDIRRTIRILVWTQAFQRDCTSSTKDPVHKEELLAAFPLTRLRAEQVASATVQTSSLRTIDFDSPFLTRLFEYANVRDFVEKYGDAGEDELAPRGGNISQRLVMMNGKVVKDRTNGDLLTAAGRIGKLAPTDISAIETSFLVCLTRRPNDSEKQFFLRTLAGAKGKDREAALEDLFWSLVNSTEFSWKH